MSKVVRRIPISESSVPTLCTTQNGEQYLITGCPEKRRYTLWKIVEDGYIKITTSFNPLDFDEIIPYKKGKK